MTVYLSETAIIHLVEAQAVVDRHITSCPVCTTDRHCHARQQAEQVFERYDQLPRRTPGLTQDRWHSPWIERHDMFAGRLPTVTSSDERNQAT